MAISDKHAVSETSPPRTERALTLINVGVFVALLCVVAAQCLTDFDLPWHMSIGRQIWARHGIPQVDELAYTHGPVRYTEALASVLFFGAYRFGGLLGVQVFGAAVTGVVVAATYARLRDRGPLGWFVLALCLAALRAWLFVSTSHLSFAFLALTLFVLDRHRREVAAGRPSRALLWLSPILFLWANAHGYVAMGATICAMYGGYRVLSALASGRAGDLLPEVDGREAGKSVGAIVLALLSASVNTLGWRVLLATNRFNEQIEDITEWARPTLKILLEDEPFILSIVALTVLALAVGRNERGRRMPSLFELGLLVLAAVCLGRAVRLIPLAALLLSGLIADRLAHAVGRRPLVVVAAGAAPALAFCWLLLRPVASYGVGWEPRYFPVGATDFVEAAQPRGHMYDFMAFGGYLIWRLHPRFEVFMDGRNTRVRDASVCNAASRAQFEDSVFVDLTNRYDMQWAMVRAREDEVFDRPLARSPSFRMVFLDDVAAVYVRTGGPNDAIAAKGYRLLRHAVSLGEVLGLAMSGERAEDLVHDADLATAQAPNSPRAAFFAASAAIAKKDAAAFDKWLSRLAQLSPGHPALAVLRQAFRAHQ